MKNAKKYESINWKQCNIELFKLQSEILKAYKTGVVADVLKAQHKLMRSFAARALAVRKVTTNKWKNTYGIDKVLLKSNEDKFKAIRNVNCSKNAFFSGNTKNALAKFQKGYCPVCDASLFNDEELEVHHIKPRRDGEDHSLKNLKLLHALCHRQVEYSKDSNLRAIWREQGIIL